MKILLVFLCLSSTIWASNIPDGAWNSHLWSKSHLIQGVKKNDPDALAEWAYCARFGMMNLPYNINLIYNRSKEAADKGSLIGKYLLAKLLRHGEGVKLDSKKAYKMFSELSEQGCPDAWVELAGLYINGEQVNKDYDKAQRLLKKAQKAGAMRTLLTLADLYGKRDYKHKNREKKLKLKLQSFEVSKNIFSANSIYYLVVYERQSERDGGSISDKTLAEATKVVQQGVFNKLPFAYYTQSFYELKRGDVHKGVMLQMKAANAGCPYAMRNMATWLHQGRKYNYGGKYQLLAKGSYKDSLKASKYAYAAGIRSPLVVANYVRPMAMATGKGSKEKRKLAEKILKEQINSGQTMAHSDLAWIRISSYLDFNGTKEESNIGFAHLIYTSNTQEYALRLLMIHYKAKGQKDIYDPVRAVAIAKYGMKKYNENKDPILYKEIKKTIKLEKQLTKKQKQEVEKLLSEGFPTSEKFRKPAYQLLIASGDMSKEQKFNSWQR